MSDNAHTLQQQLAAIRVLIFDVDGVLTDGGLIVGNNGEEYKRFHSRDGHGIKMLQASGVDIAIITGRSSGIVTHRCNELGVEHVYQGCRDKRIAFQALRDKLSLDRGQFAYMGDDVVDLPVMRQVGMAMAVADAHALVKQHAHWVSQYNGGQGAAREACEAIMQARGTLDNILNSYLH